jgi:hypothetical protein
VGQQDFWDVTLCNLQNGKHVSGEPASSVILKEEAAVSSAVFVPTHNLTGRNTTHNHKLTFTPMGMSNLNNTVNA